MKQGIRDSGRKKLIEALDEGDAIVIGHYLSETKYHPY